MTPRLAGTSRCPGSIRRGTASAPGRTTWLPSTASARHWAGGPGGSTPPGNKTTAREPTLPSSPLGPSLVESRGLAHRRGAAAAPVSKALRAVGCGKFGPEGRGWPVGAVGVLQGESEEEEDTFGKLCVHSPTEGLPLCTLCAAAVGYCGLRLQTGVTTEEKGAVREGTLLSALFQATNGTLPRRVGRERDGCIAPVEAVSLPSPCGVCLWSVCLVVSYRRTHGLLLSSARFTQWAEACCGAAPSMSGC